MDLQAFKQVCEMVSEGQPLAEALRDPLMTVRASDVYAFARANPDAADMLEQARRDGAAAKFDQVTALVNRLLAGDIRPDAARIAIDALRWQAERLDAARFGAKAVEVKHTGQVTLEGILRDIGAAPLDAQAWVEADTHDAAALPHMQEDGDNEG